ncbi:MAG: aspartate-semialdehyde dehydrogenase [Lactobacillales bacterium]|jgi:aspartate-semialdehyde dehydrogenase|nr:aspartate-semialdehyde dehydrogenase [Lactobacillales bacterium]
MSGYVVAVVGATGAVGKKMIQMLEDSTLPVSQIKLLASKRSEGRELTFKGKTVLVEELTSISFVNVDIALFSAGGSVSKEFAPKAVQAGCVVIDNTSHFRMDSNVPLVVPEVNENALFKHQGIIACPNCSTIQMMVALEPLRKVFGLTRIIVSTYQAVSGAGNRAIFETERELREILNDGVAANQVKAEILPTAGDKKHFPIAFNALPQIDVFAEDDYTYEEWKMINETKKIMDAAALKVAVTCVRIPVLSGHSESVYFEIEKENVTSQQIKDVLTSAPGVILEDDPKTQTYPQAINSVGCKEVFVGRIRRDLDEVKGFHMWVVADNLLKGAALNSVQIAESLHKLKLV